jgi:hypothetical protein
MKEVQDTDAETIGQWNTKATLVVSWIFYRGTEQEATLVTAEARRGYNRNVRKQGFGL